MVLAFRAFWTLLTVVTIFDIAEVFFSFWIVLLRAVDCLVARFLAACCCL